MSARPDYLPGKPSRPVGTGVDVERVWSALNAFATRVGKTDDPREHQKAGQQLQRELDRAKIRSN